jgi:hypothetical protein
MEARPFFILFSAVLHNRPFLYYTMNHAFTQSFRLLRSGRAVSDDSVAVFHFTFSGAYDIISPT